MRANDWWTTSPPDRLMVSAGSISSRRFVEWPVTAWTNTGGEIAAGQDRLGIYLPGNRNGLVALGQCPVEVVRPQRRGHSHPGQGLASLSRSPARRASARRRSPSARARSEVAQDKVEIRLGLVDGHQGLSVHRVPRWPAASRAWS